MLICRGLIKYGYASFRLEILEYCSPEERFVREGYYISKCTPEYNIVQTPNTMPSRSGVVVKNTSKLKIGVSQPSRIPISVTDITTNTKAYFDSINLAAKSLGVHGGQISLYFSRKQVKPFLQKYIINIEGRLDLNENTKEIESWHAGVSIEVNNIITNDIKIYPSIRAAARNLDLAHSTIRKYIESQDVYKERYVFKKSIAV